MNTNKALNIVAMHEEAQTIKALRRENEVLQRQLDGYRRENEALRRKNEALRRDDEVNTDEEDEEDESMREMFRSVFAAGGLSGEALEARVEERMRG